MASYFTQLFQLPYVSKNGLQQAYSENLASLSLRDGVLRYDSHREEQRSEDISW